MLSLLVLLAVLSLLTRLLFPALLAVLLTALVVALLVLAVLTRLGLPLRLSVLLSRLLVLSRLPLLILSVLPGVVLFGQPLL